MEDTRFELRLSRERRRELAELADRCGLSSADLVRLSVRRLLDNPGMLLEQAAAERVSRANLDRLMSNREQNSKCWI